MSIDIYRNDWQEKLDAEKAKVKATLDAETLSLIEQWENYNPSEDNQKAWEANNEHMKPLEDKYIINFSNANFAEFWRLLGMIEDYGTTEEHTFCQSEDFPYSGELDGGKLEILRNRAKTLLTLVREHGDQFTTMTTESREQGKATVIVCGRTALYFERKFEHLIEVLEGATGIYWA